jgi:hypothetical protein
MNKYHLLNVYETINLIAHKHRIKGVERSAWFYSDEEFQRIKSCKRNNIL